MKRYIKITLCGMIAALITALSCASAFAASKLTVNSGAKLSEGDTLTYTMYLSDCDADLCGIQMQLFYDNEYLELVPGTLSFPKLTGAVSNDGLEGLVPFNWTSASDFVSFKEAEPLVTADFKVKKGGDCDITYFITEMYGPDMTYMKSFTLTESISSGGKVLLEKSQPIVNTVKENLDEYQGTFINYADGKGSENGSGEGHYEVKGEFTPDVPGATEVTKDSPSDNGGILLICVALAVIIAIIFAIILRRRFSAKA